VPVRALAGFAGDLVGGMPVARRELVAANFRSVLLFIFGSLAY
jgi:hypothetical protein